MLCDHSGNYGRLERGRTEQGSEKMTIVKRLYTGVMPDKTASRLIKRIKKRKPCADVYVITLPLFEDGLLEDYEANEGRSVFSYTGYYPGCIRYDRKV